MLKWNYLKLEVPLKIENLPESACEFTVVPQAASMHSLGTEMINQCSKV